MSKCGSPVKDVLTRFVEDDGKIVFRVTGRVNIQNEIDSHRLDCDINNIIARYTAGDVSVLMRGNPSFGDFTETPKSLADMLNQVHNAEDAFSRLPADLRSKFDNSFEKFFTSLDTPTTINILKDYYSVSDSSDSGSVSGTVKEVASDES